MSTSHTPGPKPLKLELNRGGVRGATLRTADGEATICTLAYWNEDDPVGELWGYARLIAAAPELLRALKGFGSDYPDGKPCFCEMRVGNPNVRNHSKQCTDTRVLLAEIEGEK